MVKRKQGSCKNRGSFINETPVVNGLVELQLFRVIITYNELKT